MKSIVARGTGLEFYNTGMAQEETDQEFVAALRVAIDGYLSAVDQWESAYHKYYRLPGYSAKISSDLEAEHRQYAERRDELKQMLPRARRLCLKYRMREPFSGLVRVSFGRYAPQQRLDSAIGRNERNAATVCLVDLMAACREWAERGPEDPVPEPGKRSWIRRIKNYFY